MNKTIVVLSYAAMELANRFLSGINAVRQEMLSVVTPDFCFHSDNPRRVDQIFDRELVRIKRTAKDLARVVPELGMKFQTALAKSLDATCSDSEPQSFDEYFTTSIHRDFRLGGSDGLDFSLHDSWELMASLFNLLDTLICLSINQSPQTAHLGEGDEQIARNAEYINKTYMAALDIAKNILDEVSKSTRETMLNAIKLTEHFCKPHEIIDALNIRVS